MHKYLISVLSKDRIGIIANISKSIEKLNGNLGDLSQNVLDGYFSMILIASFSNSYSAEQIQKTLSDNYSQLYNKDFSILVWPVSDKPYPGINARETDEKYVLTASAKDRKGLVAEISAFCVNQRLNILSLNTEIRDNAYNMIFILDAEKALPMTDIRKNLKALEQESGLRLMLQHYKIFKATNEIKI